MKYQTLLESLRSWNPAFVPKENASYTLRYVFYRKSDLEKNINRPCFSVVSGLWIAHEEMFKNIQGDEDISSCVAEYVCEYDANLVGACFLVRERDKQSDTTDEQIQNLSAEPPVFDGEKSINKEKE